MGNIVAFHPEECVYFPNSSWKPKSGRSADLFSMDVVVQPSVSWMDLNEKIKDSGLFFPVDPGPPVSLRANTRIASFSDFGQKTQAKIGGMIATNCR